MSNSSRAAWPAHVRRRSRPPRGEIPGCGTSFGAPRSAGRGRSRSHARAAPRSPRCRPRNELAAGAAAPEGQRNTKPGHSFILRGRIHPEWPGRQFYARVISIAHGLPIRPSPAFVVGGGARGGDDRRLPRRGQICPPGVPAARGRRRRCLNHRQVGLEQRLSGLGLVGHPEFCRVTGLEVLVLGRISGNVDAGCDAGRGEADGARRGCRRHSRRRCRRRR